MVSVKAGKVPTFLLAAKGTIVNPAEEVIIRGWLLFFFYYYYGKRKATNFDACSDISAAVENAEGTCVYWECVKEEDTLCVDLSAHSKSAESVCFSSGKSVRGFHLVIPGGVLEAGSRYKFRAVGSNKEGKGSATTVVETMNRPTEGSCEVLNQGFTTFSHTFTVV